MAVNRIGVSTVSPTVVLVVTLFNVAMLAAVGCALVGLASGGRTRVAAVVGGLLALATAVGLAPQVNVFGLMQLATWVAFVHFPLFLLGVARILRNRSRAAAVGSLALALAVAATGAHAFFVEPRRLEVSRIRLVSDALDRPIRIGVVADLQTDSPGEFERDVMLRLMRAKPDLILFTGDYLQVSRRDYPDRARLLNAIFREVDLDAPLGVFAVGGNTDPAGLWATVFDGLPVNCFTHTTSVSTGPLRVTGLELWDSFDRTLAITRAGRYHVVFGHGPDFAQGTVEADLLLAGHTHGGQVRLPWIGPLVTLSSVPRSWAAGVTRLDDRRTLVVSRGIGMERGQAPRLRLLCRPELVLIDVVPRD